MSCTSFLPYHSVYLDCDFRDFPSAVAKCFHTKSNRQKLLKELQDLWTISSNPNPVLPCLSARSALDLYLKVMKFPKGSEILMSAINIPTVATIVREHGLKIVPVDVSIEDVAPKVEKLSALKSEKTVAMLVAHLFGVRFDMKPYIKFAGKHSLHVIEDCAEIFSGFDYLGHPQADISLFSFGVIKYYTSFGGAIAKVRDQQVFNMMKAVHSSYPTQSSAEYLQKVVKYSFIYAVLNCPRVVRTVGTVCRAVGFDPRNAVVGLLRGFPRDMMEKIRYKPCRALLETMVQRQSSFNMTEFCNHQIKGQYVHHRLPDGLEKVAGEATHNSYWLFPVLTANPENFVEIANALGLEAYRGATQLNIIEPENGNSVLHPASSFNYPHEAKYLIDHVVYLPINKTVPFHVLDRMIGLIKTAVHVSESQSESHQIKFVSKL